MAYLLRDRRRADAVHPDVRPQAQCALGAWGDAAREQMEREGRRGRLGRLGLNPDLEDEGAEILADRGRAIRHWGAGRQTANLALRTEPDVAAHCIPDAGQSAERSGVALRGQSAYSVHERAARELRASLRRPERLASQQPAQHALAAQVFQLSARRVARPCERHPLGSLLQQAVSTRWLAARLQELWAFLQRELERPSLAPPRPVLQEQQQRPEERTLRWQESQHRAS